MALYHVENEEEGLEPENPNMRDLFNCDHNPALPSPAQVSPPDVPQEVHQYGSINQQNPNQPRRTPSRPIPIPGAQTGLFPTFPPLPGPIAIASQPSPRTEEDEERDAARAHLLPHCSDTMGEVCAGPTCISYCKYVAKLCYYGFLALPLFKVITSKFQWVILQYAFSQACECLLGVNQFSIM